MCNYTFSKVDHLRRGRSGTESQEEAYLKFSQAEGNGKVGFIKDSFNHCSFKGSSVLRFYSLCSIKDNYVN